jgi:predicted  nucleic acid-binding Zn-ribbon protein
MAGPMPVFREIHRLRSFEHALKEQLDRIPRQRKNHQNKLAKQEQALLDTQEAIRKLKVTASDKDKELKGKDAQIKRYQEQLDQVTSRKEDDALRLQIAHAKTVCGHLEDEIFQALSEVDEKTPQIPELEKAVTAARDELAKFEAESKTRQADLEAQLAQARAELKAVESNVPDDLRPQYNRTIASLGHDGLAVVRDRTCTACYTELIRQTITELEDERFVVCKSCGRILYLPEIVKRGQDEG